VGAKWVGMEPVKDRCPAHPSRRIEIDLAGQPADPQTKRIADPSEEERTKDMATGFLARVLTGLVLMAPRLLIYGTPGIGKTQLASHAPGVIFCPTEDGMGQIDKPRFPLAQSFEDVDNALAALHHEKHDYKTVVVDTVDWLERLIWDQLCKSYGVSSIEKVDGGYGKGYIHALTYWRKILDHLAALRDEKGMMVVLLAHSKVERFEDPEGPAYDRYSPRLNKHAAQLLTEWTDAVLFATRKIITRTEDGSFNRSRTIAAGQGKDGGERILRCIGGPSCIAKNRYNLPAELPLDWPTLMGHIAGQMAATEPDALPPAAGPQEEISQ